jgi:hypothetical protein
MSLTTGTLTLTDQPCSNSASDFLHHTIPINQLNASLFKVVDRRVLILDGRWDVRTQVANRRLCTQVINRRFASSLTGRHLDTMLSERSSQRISHGVGNILRHLRCSFHVTLGRRGINRCIIDRSINLCRYSIEGKILTSLLLGRQVVILAEPINKVLAQGTNARQPHKTTNRAFVQSILLTHVIISSKDKQVFP